MTKLRSLLRDLLHRLEQEEVYDILRSKENITDELIAKTIRSMFMRNPFDGEVEEIKRLLRQG